MFTTYVDYKEQTCAYSGLDPEAHTFPDAGETPVWVEEATARVFAALVEGLVSEYGWHAALTGGCLYGLPGKKHKDIDIVLYPHNKTPEVQNPDMLILYLVTKLNYKLENVRKIVGRAKLTYCLFGTPGMSQPRIDLFIFPLESETFKANSVEPLKQPVLPDLPLDAFP